MKELSPEQIQENWNKLIQLINDNFSGERLEKLLKMYDYFEEQVEKNTSTMHILVGM